MHKKLAADLTSLAHSILQMKNKDDVFALKVKAHQVYEKLSVLTYVEEYINQTPNPEHSKEELLAKIEDISKETEPKVEIVETKEPEEKVEAEKTQQKIVEEVEQIELAVEESINDVADKIDEEIEEILDDVKHLMGNEDVQKTEEKNAVNSEENSLDKELEGTIAVDVVTDLFESASKKSLNDRLNGDIQIGLNDRIAFVKNLFDGNQEDFNRVISQLNTLKTEKEAKKFINKMVKPDYDWTDKEEMEERFMGIIERKFA